MDYPIDYFSDMATKPVTNGGFVASNFRLVIYGQCVNPAVSIADHTYQVNCTVGANEYLTIDSSAKKVFLTAQDGTITNMFNNRNRDSYVFEKIPTGQNVVSWNGGFGFDIILLEERSEPKWT
jgi:phage-related protein